MEPEQEYAPKEKKSSPIIIQAAKLVWFDLLKLFLPAVLRQGNE